MRILLHSPPFNLFQQQVETLQMDAHDMLYTQVCVGVRER